MGGREHEPQLQHDQQAHLQAHDTEQRAVAKPPSMEIPKQSGDSHAFPATRQSHQAVVLQMQRRYGNAYVQRYLQRQAEETSAPAALIVDDDAESLQPDQMRKSDFLNQLREAVCATANEALRDTVYSSIGCPYIVRVFSRLAGRSADYVERGIHRYAQCTDTRWTSRPYRRARGFGWPGGGVGWGRAGGWRAN